ncbi:MAG: hypothetical protein ABI469_08090 [Gemmatimonadales bacterium]
MKIIRRLPLTCLAALLLATSACRSARGPDVIIRASPRDASPKEEIALITADSLIFAAVVREQVAGKDDEYPRRLERLRYDSRPYGTASGYPENFAGVQGIDPTLSFGRVGDAVIDRIAENRERILRIQGVPKGEPFNYKQCGGVGIPKPPSPRRSASAPRAKGSDVHSGCPKTTEYYLTVGLPVRGQPEGLKDLRDVRGDRVSPRGDVWTVLVDENAIGPTGWTKSQYAWLFKRNRSGRLELDSTILIAVVE